MFDFIIILRILTVKRLLILSTTAMAQICLLAVIAMDLKTELFTGIMYILNILEKYMSLDFKFTMSAAYVKM